MKKPIPILLTLLIFTAISRNINAQGCSDPGFCTLSSIKPQDGGFTDAKNRLRIGASIGQADYDISVFANYLEFNRALTNKIGLDAKITSLSQSGNGISTFGLSDIYLNANFKLSNNFRFTLGTKLPLADGNTKKDGISLPMDYQSSLGTVDIIIGIGVSVEKLQIMAAFQQPVSKNENQFMSEDYPQGTLFNSIHTTNKFERSGDVLLRVSYPFALSKKLTFSPGLLPIYHLMEDRFSWGDGSGGAILGSKGLTLNGNLFLDYSINEKNGIQFSLGVPFIVRDVRPDGLTRSFVAGLEYNYSF